MRRPGSVVLAAVLAAGGLSPAHEARQVSNAELNVRSGPGTGYSLRGVAHQYEKYAVVEKSGSWSKIWWAGNTGWIYTPLTTTAGGTGAEVATESLNVRSGAGTGYAAVGTAHRGEIYVQIATSGGWKKIWFGGAARWISGAYASAHPLYAVGTSVTRVDIGTFQVTYYWLLFESDFTGTRNTPIYDPYWRVIEYAPYEYVRQLKIEGSGKLRDGRTVSYYSSGRFEVVSEPWGRGALGTAITPLRTIAVDRSVIPLGSKIYIPRAVGFRMPDGTTHDGYFKAEDTGGAIIGRHIDVFAGRKSWGVSLADYGLVSGSRLYRVY